MTEMRIEWPDSVQFGDVVYPPGGSFGPRQQTYIQFVILHSGEMTVWVDGELFHAAAPSISRMLPGHTEHFAFAKNHDTWHSYVHISLPKYPPALLRHLRRLPWKLALSNAMQTLVFSGLELRHAALPTRGELQKTLALQMLWRYIGESAQFSARETTAERQPLNHPSVAAACEHIAAFIAEPLDLAAIAEAASVSPSHLIRLFQHHLGTTPIAYLWAQRVQRGIELLEQTGLPVGIVAERCGFTSRHHFARRIHTATGLSPSAIRRRAWRAT